MRDIIETQCEMNVKDEPVSVKDSVKFSIGRDVKLQKAAGTFCSSLGARCEQTTGTEDGGSNARTGRNVADESRIKHRPVTGSSDAFGCCVTLLSHPL